MGFASAAQLPNSYIPPPSNALTAGGSSNFLQTPNRPQNQYLPPGQNRGVQQTFNSFGQPTQFSQGSYSQGGQGGQGAYQQGGQGAYAQGGQRQYQQQQPSGPVIPILRYENSPNLGDGSYSFE